MTESPLPVSSDSVSTDKVLDWAAGYWRRRKMPNKEREGLTELMEKEGPEVVREHLLQLVVEWKMSNADRARKGDGPRQSLAQYIECTAHTRSVAWLLQSRIAAEES